MPRIPKLDPEREARLEDEILVDAYGELEQAVAWWTYLGDQLEFPFKAKCVLEISRSPLEIGDQVSVLDLADSDECEDGMYVVIEYLNRKLSVPLEQLKGIRIGEEAKTAIEDWQYWLARGHGF